MAMSATGVMALGSKKLKLAYLKFGNRLWSIIISIFFYELSRHIFSRSRGHGGETQKGIESEA